MKLRRFSIASLVIVGLLIMGALTYSLTYAQGPLVVSSLIGSDVSADCYSVTNECEFSVDYSYTFFDQSDVPVHTFFDTFPHLRTKIYNLAAIPGFPPTFSGRVEISANGESSAEKVSCSGKDITAPAAITDLAASEGTAPGTVDLSWTAPGDDGTTCAVSNYIVRYSTTAILTEEIWNLATDVTGEPAPLPS